MSESSVQAEQDRVVTVRARVQRIADDALFYCDVNPMDGEASWMLIIGVGEHVHLALCEECKRHFDTAVVEQ